MLWRYSFTETPLLSQVTPAVFRSRSSISGTRPAPWTAMSASKVRESCPVDDLDLGARASGNVGELKGDVASADEDDLARQPVEFEELCASGQVLLARKVECCASGSTGDHHMAARDSLVVHLECCLIQEVGAAVQHADTRAGEALLVLLWHRVRESALEAHEVRPLNGEPRS